MNEAQNIQASTNAPTKRLTRHFVLAAVICCRFHRTSYEAQKKKTKIFKDGERGLLLLEALELIWYMEQGYSMQKHAKALMKKCNYDFYNREPKFIK